MNFVELFGYNHWANAEEVRHLRSLAAPPQGAVAVLAHIVGAEWLWLGRLRGQAKPAVVWPDLTLEQCAEQIEKLGREWRRELASVDMDAVTDYVNSKGERWSSRAEDTLMHVILHGSYHRGQIATLVRQGGDVPAYTDYIHCIRQGFLLPGEKKVPRSGG
jgi:uncharacterized damage-inducible protein DinB